MSKKINLETKSLHSLEKEMKKVLALDLEDQELPMFSGGGSFPSYSSPYTIGEKTPEQLEMEQDEFLREEEKKHGNSFGYE